MKKRAWIILLIIIVAAGAAFWFWRFRETEKPVVLQT
jgi:hypothetical protein